MKKMNWNEYTMEKKKGKITDIQEGKVSDFVQNKGAWEEVINRLAIEATISYENIIFKKMFILPVDKKIATTSELGRFKEQYGQFPVIGMEVNVTRDKKGFLILELL